MKRPTHGDIDDVAVLRCARGDLRYDKLTWGELELVIRHLERFLSDVDIDKRIGAKRGQVTTIRSRRRLPRLTPAPRAPLSYREAQIISRRHPRRHPAVS